MSSTTSITTTIHECLAKLQANKKCIEEQEAELIVWAEGNMEPSQRSVGGLSGSVEITGALTEAVKVLKFLKRNVVTEFEEVVDVFNKEHLVEGLSEEDSELELEVTPDELTELAMESEEGEWYWE